MKEIIATEQVKNAKGYTVAIRYHFADKTFRERKVFIPPKKEGKK